MMPSLKGDDMPPQLCLQFNPAKFQCQPWLLNFFSSVISVKQSFCNHN